MVIMKYHKCYSFFSCAFVPTTCWELEFTVLSWNGVLSWGLAALTKLSPVNHNSVAKERLSVLSWSACVCVCVCHLWGQHSAISPSHCPQHMTKLLESMFVIWISFQHTLFIYNNTDRILSLWTRFMPWTTLPRTFVIPHSAQRLLQWKGSWFPALSTNLILFSGQ